MFAVLVSDCTLRAELIGFILLRRRQGKKTGEILARDTEAAKAPSYNAVAWSVASRAFFVYM